MTTDPEMKDLIDLLSKGDREAGRQFVERYHAEILRHIKMDLRKRRMISSRGIPNGFDPQSILNSTVGAFLNRLNGNDMHFENPGKVIAYLGQISRNKINARFREFFKQRSVELTETIADPLPPPDEALINNFWKGNFLDGLDPLDRSIVEQIEGGSSVNEIAKGLGLSRSTVYRHLDDVILRLRNQSHGEQ